MSIQSACPNAPDLETGEHPCERGPNDECLTCGWTPTPPPEQESVEALVEEAVASARSRMEWGKRRPSNADLALLAMQEKLAAAERERDELGNKLAQERAKPGGSFDQWAALQAAEERVRVLEEALENSARGHHATITPSKLHHPEHVRFDRCQAKPCVQARAALKEQP